MNAFDSMGRQRFVPTGKVLIGAGVIPQGECRNGLFYSHAMPELSGDAEAVQSALLRGPRKPPRLLSWRSVLAAFALGALVALAQHVGSLAGVVQ